MDKEKIEHGLADLVASTVVTFFKLLESYLKFCFSMLQKGVKGFLFLIGLHLFLALLILGKGL